MTVPRTFNRDKFKGMLIGGAIGDALGAPVETWGIDKIIEVHGKPIDSYVAPIGHKWFKPEEFFPGMTTDDTQLTVATLEGLIAGKPLAESELNFDHYLDGIALAHVEESKRTVGGWGKSTQEAVRRLANGVHWSESGKTTEPNRGTGNGVPMKVSPLAAWLASNVGQAREKDKGKQFHFNQRVIDFGAMTHYSELSGHAGVVHAQAVYMCLWEKPGQMSAKAFVDCIADYVPVECLNAPEEEHTHYHVNHLTKPEHNLFDRLWFNRDELLKMKLEDVLAAYGGGSCYVYDSLPFAYAIWLRNLHSFAGILEAVNAGGDNDTNAKFVGELLGANEGLAFFQQEDHKWAIEGLRDYDKLIRLADNFCDTFGIE
jgi:ADP-ribosylglycohydrolase